MLERNGDRNGEVQAQLGSVNGDSKMDCFLARLKQCGIQAERTNGRDFPREAMMHDRGAVVPAVVVSPRSEWGVAQTLKLLKEFKFYDGIPVSVKSGGHGYFNGATCSGIMVNLSSMTNRRIEGNALYLEPGCILGQTMNILARNRKAVPHGDCFGVGAGGHFLTAGWDVILARRYGLGCQSVIGGRVVLWDGSVVDVDENKHPKLLYAMRGGAVAGVGVVTEVRLRLIDEPPLATWRCTRISKEQLPICVAHNAFANSAKLPRDISVSFRFQFEPDQIEPVCSFEIASLLAADETIRYLRQALGDEVTSLVDNPSEWNEKSLLDLRMLPASDFLAANPEMLGEVTHVDLQENPLVYWQQTTASWEMARSYCTSFSYWIKPNCEKMFLELYRKFQEAQASPARERMSALIILGGSRMLELQDQCAMPLGQALARFDLRWDDPDKEEQWCRTFNDEVSEIIKSQADETVDRPYRGDIWLEEQGRDASLDAIFEEYDRRFL